MSASQKDILSSRRAGLSGGNAPLILANYTAHPNHRCHPDSDNGTDERFTSIQQPKNLASAVMVAGHRAWPETHSQVVSQHRRLETFQAALQPAATCPALRLGWANCLCPTDLTSRRAVYPLGRQSRNLHCGTSHCHPAHISSACGLVLSLFQSFTQKPPASGAAVCPPSSSANASRLSHPALREHLTLRN